MAAPDSANFFTFGFSHDWCVDENFVRISGEDHFSGLKSPRSQERCGRLAKWAWEKYPYLESSADYPARYGIYSETADFMPLVGTPSDSSRVCYLVGCNAWGQASLSAAAAMAPALLGYREFSPQEQATARLFSIRRFTGRAVADSARTAAGY
jgi:glycine/D-amino acid oxidase-like deaminating enzyme